ncbi:MAG: UDP-N-acetyl-D-glucosamine dehydrogenase [Deltaproteobacteria bacterium RIFCSPLOWO2_12_FULL_57_22]|nr:MAG: UDP-N-acetyl-D-glucosamine dehydrogenase [Deltaproteobacteria bacterium RIFCSPLOWO2_12_FULL_57_22]
MRMKSRKEALNERIVQRKAKVCVLGLGYVGLPLALRFAEVGFPVFGIDTDDEKVEKINRGISYIPGVSLNLQEPKVLRASKDFSHLDDADAAIICVPTPLSKTREPDLSLVLEAAQTVAKHLHPGELIVLESTTYPGTTREVLLPLLEERGLKSGQDFFLAYSPERVDPGNEIFTLSNTPKVIAGISPSCLALAQTLYSQIVQRVVPVSTTDTAEIVKLLENTFRSVNIALVNEFAIMCDRLGLNVWEVIQAAATKPFGFMPFFPGPGLGGHCIPVDPHYLSWKLRLLAYKARSIELADEINREMPRFVAEKVGEALNRQRKSVNGSKILILGVAYKKDSTDVRESPALDVMKLLREKGGDIFYHDPWVPRLSFNGRDLGSVPLDAETLSTADVVVVITDHSRFDAGEVVEHSRLIIDARNLTHGIESAKIVRL